MLRSVVVYYFYHSLSLKLGLILEICKLIVSDIALQLCLISAGMNM